MQPVFADSAAAVNASAVTPGTVPSTVSRIEARVIATELDRGVHRESRYWGFGLCQGVGERHGEAGRVRCGEEFLRAGVALRLTGSSRERDWELSGLA